MGNAGRVVARVQYDQNTRVPVPLLPSLCKAFDDVADLASGDRGQVGAGLQPDRVEQRGPRRSLNDKLSGCF